MADKGLVIYLSNILDSMHEYFLIYRVQAPFA
jgi:hypothetical protein